MGRDAGGEFEAGLRSDSPRLRYLQCEARGGAGSSATWADSAGTSQSCRVHGHQSSPAPPMEDDEDGGAVSWARARGPRAPAGLGWAGPPGTPSSGGCDRSCVLWTPGGHCGCRCRVAGRR